MDTISFSVHPRWLSSTKFISQIDFYKFSGGKFSGKSLRNGAIFVTTEYFSQYCDKEDTILIYIWIWYVSIWFVCGFEEGLILMHNPKSVRFWDFNAPLAIQILNTFHAVVYLTQIYFGRNFHIITNIRLYFDDDHSNTCNIMFGVNLGASDKNSQFWATLIRNIQLKSQTTENICQYEFKIIS